MEGGDRKVLVVGGAGYVGNVLVRRLLEAGYGVRVLDRMIFDQGEAIAPLLERDNFDLVYGDFRDKRVIDGALDGITDVVLLGGDWSAIRSPRPTRSSPTRSTSTAAAPCSTRSTGAGSTASSSPRPAATTGCGRATSRRPRSPSCRRSRSTPRRRSSSSSGSSRGRRLGRLHADGAADRDRVRALAADALRPDDLRVHAARWRPARSWSSTTPTPGGPTATSPTSRRRS